MLMKKVITSRKGRKCKQSGCKQILSVYNHDIYCHSHSSQNEGRPKGIKKA